MRLRKGRSGDKVDKSDTEGMTKLHILLSEFDEALHGPIVSEQQFFERLHLRIACGRSQCSFEQPKLLGN